MSSINNSNKFYGAGHGPIAQRPSNGSTNTNSSSAGGSSLAGIPQIVVTNYLRGQKSLTRKVAPVHSQF
jgi:hypothetical protein